jgi:hypothetical protein
METEPKTVGFSLRPNFKELQKLIFEQADNPKTLEVASTPSDAEKKTIGPLVHSGVYCKCLTNWECPILCDVSASGYQSSNREFAKRSHRYVAKTQPNIAQILRRREAYPARHQDEQSSNENGIMRNKKSPNPYPISHALTLT